MEVNEENETLMKQYDREKQKRKEIEEVSQSVSHQPHTYTEAASLSGIVCSEALSCTCSGTTLWKMIKLDQPFSVSS